MSLLVDRPSNVIRRFWELYKEDPVKATDAHYKFSQDTDYIRRYRIAKDMKWVAPTEYGDLDITINLSKPKKIRKPSQQQSWQNRHPIQNVCFAWKTKATQDD